MYGGPRPSLDPLKEMWQGKDQNKPCSHGQYKCSEEGWYR